MALLITIESLPDLHLARNLYEVVLVSSEFL